MTKRAQASRRSIVQAAIRLFAEHGNDRFTVREVCRLAGVSGRTFYRHFENLDDVLDRGLKQQWVELRDRLRGSLERDTLAVTAATFRSALHEVLEQPAFFRALLRGTFNGCARVLDLAVEISRTKADLVSTVHEPEIYFAAGVVVSSLYFALDHPDEVRRNEAAVVERAINFIRMGSGMVPRSIEAMERSGA